jgi:hypothetical protein
MIERELVGSVTEEAAKLVDALRERSGPSTFVKLVDSDHLATGAPECQWCPVCRTIRALRESGPELTGQLEEAVLALRGILQTVLVAHAERGRGS